MTQGKCSTLNNLTMPKSTGIYERGHGCQYLWYFHQSCYLESPKFSHTLNFWKARAQSGEQGDSTVPPRKLTEALPAAITIISSQGKQRFTILSDAFGSEHNSGWQGPWKALVQALAQSKVSLEPRLDHQLGLDNFQSSAVTLYLQHWGKTSGRAA